MILILTVREGVNLQISNLKTQDSGTYTCEVEYDDREPLKQDNVLQVLGGKIFSLLSPRDRKG